MRNLFVKTYVAFAALILISFTFAGSVFMAQIGRYSMQQKKTQLETSVSNVQALIENNETIVTSKKNRSILTLYLQQMAVGSNSQMMVADANGNIQISASSDEESQTLNADAVSEDLLNEINSNGEYFGMGTLSGLFSEDYYIAGVRCLDKEGNTIAVVIAATMAAETRALMQDVMRTYVLIVFLTLILTLIISWFLSDILTRPLKGIVGAAKQFARGKFDVRVPEDNNCDEIDELAVSFNNMVSILQQQEALSRDFVANVSHELKTPMTSISGFADGILDGTIPPEKHRHYLEIISQESHRLSRMVVRMLDTARIESGEIVITPMSFDLSDTAIQVLLSFEKQLENKKLDVNVDLEDYLMVNGDHDYIYRVVYNLVDNAVKFVEENGRLTIKTEISGKTARFTIRNTGSEIPQEDLPHVFDRFYKVDRSRSMDRTGAGLGLYLVKSIVILHGGNISVGSNNGETEFSFTIPLAPKPTNTSSNVPELTQN